MSTLFFSLLFCRCFCVGAFLHSRSVSAPSVLGDLPKRFYWFMFFDQLDGRQGILPPVPFSLRLFPFADGPRPWQATPLARLRRLAESLERRRRKRVVDWQKKRAPSFFWSPSCVPMSLSSLIICVLPNGMRCLGQKTGDSIREMAALHWLFRSTWMQTL